MEHGHIVIRGASEHNLRRVDLDLPRGRLIVFTGVSGSGKSSLAFDTLYAEGRRRYLESLSTSARAFLGQLERPRVELIRGLAPTIAIDQHQASPHPRATVGTLTEITEHLRLLYARVGQQQCHACGTPIHRLSAEEIVHRILKLEPGTRFSLLAPLDIPGGTSPVTRLLELRRQGFARVRIDETLTPLDELPPLDMRQPHTIELVVDRLVHKAGMEQRLTDSVETTLRFGGGRLLVLTTDGILHRYSELPRCTHCGTDVPVLSPALLSFNSPKGFCPDCQGTGMRLEPDPQRVVPDPSLSLAQGAVQPWAAAFERQDSATYAVLSTALTSMGIDLETPFHALTDAQRQLILYGSEGLEVEVEWEGERVRARFEGAIPALRRHLLEARGEESRREPPAQLSQVPCPSCDGMRLRPEALAIRVGGDSLGQLSRRPLGELHSFLEHLHLEPTAANIAHDLLLEVRKRLKFLLEVGLDYLTLERQAPTLSGGETQRIRLASQLGSELTGVVYVLDEPSIGLHARDQARLLESLLRLRDLGNTLIVVEHDEETIRAADILVDFGPGAGPAGGRVVYAGPVEGILEQPGSLTGDYLAGRRRIARERPRLKASPRMLVIEGARANNLKDIDVALPLERLVAVTGPSGAGKSTLINEILYPAAASRLNRSQLVPGPHRAVRGLEALQRVVHLDQEPIGRSPRSIPATLIGLFDVLRKLYAQLPESRARGYSEGRFSFNVKGGRCEVCRGEGTRRVELHFLADVFVPCEVCEGRRFNRATLEVSYKGLSIADMLERPVEALYPELRHHPQISSLLFLMLEVGLGYLPLGQPAPTLSGGEAQRLRLVRELARPDSSPTLYLLDEPSMGLHFEDIARLLRVLERLVEAGHSVILIEHQLDLIRCADYVVELGPGGGERGGYLMAAGTPEEIAATPTAPSADALKQALAGASARERSPARGTGHQAS